MTILYTHEVLVFPIWVNILIIIAGVITIIAILKTTDSGVVIGASLTMMLIMLFFILVSCDAIYIPQWHETQYKVTITDEDYSLEDFLDNYEVVKIEDKLLTLKDKEQKG